MENQLIDEELNLRPENNGECLRPARWAALVDDTLIPLPERRLKVAVIKAQASIPCERVLVRDHNSPEDVVVADDAVVDLAVGNVFYTPGECEREPRPDCTAPAKLAFVVNDKPEVTIRAGQTGQTLRDLFNLQRNTELFRDVEGGADQPIQLEQKVDFSEGPVFYTRQIKSLLSITVNARVFSEHDGVRRNMDGREIAALVYPESPNETRVFEVSPEKREIALGENICLHGCEVFDVVRKKVDGGFQSPRLDLELEKLRTAGQSCSSNRRQP